MLRATGTFDVKTLPQASDGQGGGPAIGRLFLDKRFHGDLDAASVGTMLGLRTAVEGSAGYVAQEVVTGSLNGRQGSFALQHYGVMKQGQLEQTVAIIPDSGTGELTGLSGKMTIKVENGEHHYVLDYAMP